MDTQKLVSNSVLTMVAHSAMIFASTVGLPVALIMMQRVLNAADTITEKGDKGAVQVQLLQQKVDFGFEASKSEIAGIRMQLVDHEGRLRTIEREPRRAQP